MLVAIAIVSPGGASSTVQDGYTLHSLPATSLNLTTLIDRADAIIAAPAARRSLQLASTSAPIATWGDTRSLRAPSGSTAPMIQPWMRFPVRRTPDARLPC